MNFAPLWNAALVIKIHAFAAMAALLIGVAQVALPKGTVPHRTLGWAWLVLIMTMLITAPIIHGVSVGTLLDPALCYLPSNQFFWNARCAGIHLLTLYLLLVVPFTPLLARFGDITAHRNAMITIWFMSLLVAGIFTMDSKRIMHQILFAS